jgi:hypothetical protein
MARRVVMSEAWLLYANSSAARRSETPGSAVAEREDSRSARRRSTALLRAERSRSRSEKR